MLSDQDSTPRAALPPPGARRPWIKRREPSATGARAGGARSNSCAPR